GPEHPVLRQGWSALAEGGPGTVGELVRRPELDPGGTVEESLVAAGILERKSRGVLGLRFDRTPTVDPAPEEALRARLAAVLAGRERATVAD
ncbi:GPP34 family phosphoprotein, partial [Streptomyces galilaeus]